jgi:hypothetical protein
MIRFSKITHNVRKLFPELTKFFSQRSDIEFAYVFGSYGTGKEKPLSDVDIAVFLKKEIPKNQYFDIQLGLISDLVHILKTDEVDVIILNQADIILSYHVVFSRNVVFERDSEIRVAYETRVLDKYFDSEPIRRLQYEYFKQNVDEGLIFG